MRLLLKPAPGEVVLDEGGNVIDVQGITVTVNAYYERLCVQGLLLREEQYNAALTAPPSLGQLVLSGGTGDPGEVPQRTEDGTLQFGPAPNSLGTLCTDLMLGASPREGYFDGERLDLAGWQGVYNYTTGVSGAGDGMGPGAVYWRATSFKVVNGGTCFGKAALVNGVLVPDATRAMTPGRWEVLEENSEINVKQFGYVGVNAENHTYLGANYRDDQDALEAALAAVRRTKGTLLIPESTGYIVRTWFYPANGSEFEVCGVGNAYMYWYGVATRTANPADIPNLENGNCMVMMRGVTPIMRKMTLRVGGVTACGHLVGVGYYYGETVGSLTEPRILECDIQGNATSGAGSTKYGITLDPYALQGANCENVEIHSVVRKCVIASIWNRSSVQSYNLVIRGEGMQALGGFLGTANCPWGIGLLNDASATNIIIRDMDIERCGCWVRLRQYPNNLVIRGIAGEQFKKIIYTTSPGANQAICSIAVHDLRANVSGLGSDSEGGLEVFPASDKAIFNYNSNHPALHTNMTIEDGFNNTQADVSGYENALTFINCHMTRDNFVTRVSTYGGTYRGRTTIIGCTGQDGGGNGIAIPDRYGVENAPGTLVITGAATSGDVTFTVVELAADYKIEVTLVGATGALGFPYVLDSERLTTGFKIRLSAAPGGANTTTVRWRCYR